MRFEGFYVHGKREGKGKEYKVVKNRLIVSYEGSYKNGVRDGRGMLWDEKNMCEINAVYEMGKLIESTTRSKEEWKIVKYDSVREKCIDDIGTGGVGTVYKVKYSDVFNSEIETQYHEKFLAIKILHKKFENNPTIRQKLKRGISICNAIDSPYLLRTFGLVEGLRFGCVMEFCAYSVANFMSKKIDVVTKRRFLLETAKGILALHQKGIMHRDLKWGNILLTKDLKIKISDFDTVRDSDDYKLMSTEMSSTQGTVGYMAPELVRGKKYGCECDIYSFAMMIYSLMLQTNNPFYYTIKNKNYNCNRCGAFGAFDLNYHILHCDHRPLIEAEIREQFPNDILRLMIDCWNGDPKERPDISKIVEIMENSYNIAVIMKFMKSGEFLKSLVLKEEIMSNLNFIPQEFLFLLIEEISCILFEKYHSNHEVFSNLSLDSIQVLFDDSKFPKLYSKFPSKKFVGLKFNLKQFFSGGTMGNRENAKFFKADEASSEKSDMFSFGAIIYCLMNKRIENVYEAIKGNYSKSKNKVSDSFSVFSSDFIEEHKNTYSVELIYILGKMLDLDPENRISSEELVGWASRNIRLPRKTDFQKPTQGFFSQIFTGFAGLVGLDNIQTTTSSEGENAYKTERDRNKEKLEKLKSIEERGGEEDEET